jgi:glycosyltransferase involved in cell wall biosynthesis
MACGTPCLLPYSSALAEWPNGGVEYYDVYEDMPFVNTGGVNTIMDTPRLDSFIEKMEKLYTETQYRRDLGYKGYKLVTSSKYQWKEIANQFHDVFKKVLNERVSK